MTTLSDLRRETFALLAPPEGLDLPLWIERNVRLPQNVAAIAGPMRLYAYQRDVARSMGDPTVHRVTWMKGARIGATQLLAAVLGHYALNDPALQLVVMPSENDARMLITSIVEPTFDASPALRKVFSNDARKRENMTYRPYPGGSLTVVSGGSPKNLRARTARILVMDEVDALDVSSGEEGDPVALAIRRTGSFPDAKVIMTSTPVDESTSRIARAYAEGDQRIYECKCPECGDYHEITWASIQWPADRPEEAAHVCPACGCVIPESRKAEMIENGRWRATRPEVIGHHSYRSNALCSTLPSAAWGRLAVEFLAAKRDPNLLKVFVNTVLGETWRDDTEGADEGELFNRREPIGLDAIPPETLYLTAGLDVQVDRVEMATVAWTADGTPIVLAHELAWGTPLADDVWREIDDLLRRRWTHPNGGQIGYDRAFVDSGDGGTTDRVYDFARSRNPRGIFACKGAAGFQRVAAALSPTKTARLWIVGVDNVKMQILTRVTSGAAAMRFSDSLDHNWFEQFASERVEIRFERGRETRRWSRIAARRAEALDCVVYAFAAFASLAKNPDRRAEDLSSAAAPKRAPAVIRSRWMDR